MNPQQIHALLIGLAITLFATSILLFVIGGSTVVGASNVVIGCSLLTIAAAQKKKNGDNG